MADDYRLKYLETERMLISLRETSRRDLEEAVGKTERRFGKMLEEERQE